MKLLFCYREDWEKEYIQERLPDDLDIVFKEGTLQENIDMETEGVSMISIFVKSDVDKKALSRFPDLEFLSTRSTGFDHIDIKAAQEQDITVSNVPAYGANTVAEHAFGLALAVLRNIYDAYEQVREEGSFAQEGLRGYDMAGKTLGVVGTGNIGAHAVKIGHGFGMDIVAYDIEENDELVEEYGVSYVELDELLASSDVITLHVPLNEKTRHLINKDTIHNIKKGALLINTSRGPIIETEALITALEEEVIIGAGLDVLEEEGMTMRSETELMFEGHPSEESLKTVLENHYLIDHPRVIITPHIGYNTHEAVRRILDTTAENIKAFLEGKPINTVS